MKVLVAIFLFIFTTYFLLATKGTGRIPYDLDYFNPLARSFLSGRLDIPNPIVKSDLSFFDGKWYPYWGPLPAILLIPGQIVLMRYFPAAYLSLFIAGLNIVVVYLVMQRLRKLYLGRKLTAVNILIFLLFFAFGTSHLYIATRSGTWFVAQTVTFLSSALAIYILIKKTLSVKDYFLASALISASLIGRYNIVLYLIFLSLRILDDMFFRLQQLSIIRRKVVASAIPVLFFFTIFAAYNFVRFHNPLDFGFRYTVFDYFSFKDVAAHGFYSLYYVPGNLWRIFLEIPKFTLLPSRQVFLDWNHAGMSIFFVSPVFLAALLTINQQLLRSRNFINRLKVYLWVLVIAQVAMLTPFFTLGFLQVGLRYATDFALPLLILAVFGLEGKINSIVILATMMAIALNIFYLFVA